MTAEPEPQPLVEAVNRLGDLMSEDIEMRKREAVHRDAERNQTAVERYARRHVDDRPHPLSFLTFARAVPGLYHQFKAIPPEFWQEDVEDEDGRVARVACPCGETPTVPFNSIRACACERVFAFTGRSVMAANSPTGEQAQTAA